MDFPLLQQQKSLHSPRGKSNQENPTKAKSPYVFILAVELLLIKINNTKIIEELRHIHIYQVEPRIPNKMYRISDTLYKDKWTPVQFGKKNQHRS